jgi:MFS family permease
LCGVATSSTMLIVGRAVAGMGSSGLMNGGMTIVANVVPLQRRPSLTGFMMGFSQMGIITGPLVGGALTEYSTWRWCFYLNLPIGAVVAVFLAMLDIPDHIEKPPAMSVLPNLHHELDLLGFALFAPAAIQLLLALQYGGNEYAWNSATVIGLFCGAGATFLVWLAWDWHKGDNALIPLRMIQKRAVWSGSSVQFTLMSTMFTAAYFMPIYFQAIKGVSPSMSGVYLLPSILTQLIFGVGSGVLGRLHPALTLLPVVVC